ncbi:MAG TPA: dihydrofolate reductase family protein [Thermomicrobiales bacterium]|nr:dihydrofolate reductase family protein [Thermomicrobiales bacterium]HRA48030.1 dihydrofolate reductase family protein [Thermomicrobiales bacterium]
MGGERLHEWVFADPLGAVNQQIWDECLTTRAIIAGRATFEPAAGWGGDNHGGAEIYILSRHPAPDWAADWPLVHYLSDLEEIVRRARIAAGDHNILVHGSSIAQRMIRAGLLDEMVIHLVPVLLGEGLPLFAHLGVQQRELERLQVLPGEGGVTHIRYRMVP